MKIEIKENKFMSVSVFFKIFSVNEFAQVKIVC